MKTPTLKSLGEETRNGYRVTAEAKIVWNVQLQLFGKLCEVCDKYGLKVFSTAGTTIGAVREKGFIPWDDDIDVAMLRPDYDRLVAVAEKEFTAPYRFQTPYTEEGFYRGHAQLRMDGTTAILPHDFQFGYTFHQGIFIDVFVLDGVPEDEVERESLACEALNILDYMWRRKYWRHRLDWVGYRRQRKSLGEKAHWSDAKLFAYFEDLFRKHPVEASERIGPLTFLPRRESSYYPRESHDNIVLLPFEEGEMPVPCGYDAILSRRYGDYMKPVQAPTTHGEVWISAKIDYKEYVKSKNRHTFRFVYRSCKPIYKGYLKNILRTIGLWKAR